MASGDLPPGKWTAALIGPWWPGDSSALRGGETHWGTQSAAQESYSQSLSSKAKELGRNTGATASDLISRFESGSTFHLDLAEKYAEKKSAFGKGAGAIDTLRSGLKGIAQEYNAKIDQIADSQISPVLKLTQITNLIIEANGQAAFKSAAAVTTLLDAVQQILTAEGMSTSAQEFLKNQGLSTDPPKPPDAHKAAADGLGLGGGMGNNSGGTGEPGSADGMGNNSGGTGTPGSASPGGGMGGQIGGSGTGSGGGSGAGPIGVGTPGGGGGGQMPGGVGAPSLPGGGQLSPAAALGKGLSPDSLSQSFTQGMTSGQPLAAGAHSLSTGTMNAVEAGSAPAPQAPPPAQMAPPPMVAPTAAGGGGGFESAGAEHGSAAGGAPVASSGPAPAAPIGPAVVAGSVAPPPAAPVMGGAPAAPGPLPGYGADLLRTAPAVPPPISAGPVGGAPAAPVSPASSPSAGGPLVSPVDRSGAAAAGSQASANSPAAGAAAMAAAGTGAAAGAASDIAAEQKRLQRLVDAVARQEPRLAWAACVRDDGTTVLTTDLAGGWIPPHVQLPVGVDRLLDPGKRREGANVLELLGGYKTAIAYTPNTYVSEPDSDAPALTAGIRLRKVAPIDDFGPTLMDSVNARVGQRIVHMAAQAATRKSGFDTNERERFREELTAVHASAMAAYPGGGAAAWMLLAAVDALLDGHADLAQYHFAWMAASK